MFKNIYFLSIYHLPHLPRMIPTSSQQQQQLTHDMLATCLNINTTDNTLKSNEALFTKYKLLPSFAPLLLEICVNQSNTYSPEIALNAAIQLKNFIWTNWKFTNDHAHNKTLVFNEEEEQIIIITPQDKAYIRNNILDAIVYAVDTENAKIVKQLNQCTKRILRYDYETIWKEAYMNKLLSCFNSNNNQKLIYAGIVLLHQVSKLFEFETEDKHKVYNEVLMLLNDKLLNILLQCNDINVPVQAQFTYKIIKIFFKSFQGCITPIYRNDAVFEQWSSFIVKVIQTPLSVDNAKTNNKSIFWKLKHLCYQLIARIHQKYSVTKSVSKSKAKANVNADTNINETTMFGMQIATKYSPIYFSIIKTIYINEDSNAFYVDDTCMMFIYNYLSNLINKKQLCEEIITIFLETDKTKEHLIRDACMTKEDLALWDSDPKTYISMQIEEESNRFSKRQAAASLIESIISYRDATSPQKKKGPPKYYTFFMKYLLNVIELVAVEQQKENNNVISGNSSSNGIKYNLIKESIMFIIQYTSSLHEKYNSDMIEQLIATYIVPELESPVGVLREKACIFIAQFSKHNYKDMKLPEVITTKLCALLDKDKCLPVRLNSAITAASMLSHPGTKQILKGTVKVLVSIYLKLTEETDSEELVESLQIVIEHFKEEIAEFIVQLSDYLIKYLLKLIQREKDDDEPIDTSSLISNLITTFVDIIRYFVNNTQVYPQIEQHIEVILKHCLHDNIYDRIDDGLDVIEEVLKTCMNVPVKMWEHFPTLITSFIGTDEEQAELKKEFPDQLYEGFGNESLSEISKLICIYISKDPETFMTCADAQGKTYFNYTMKYVERIFALAEVNNSYVNSKKAFNILVAILNALRGKVDTVHIEICKLLIMKLQNKNYHQYLYHIVPCVFIYNPSKAITFFESVNETERILKFWFDVIDKCSDKYGMKYNLMGLCCLISIEPAVQNKMVLQNLRLVIDKMMALVDKVHSSNEKCYQKKMKDDNDDDEYEEISDDDDVDDDKAKDLLFQMASKDINGDNDFEDEDVEWNEDDDDDDNDNKTYRSITSIDKQREVLFVRDTLNHLSQSNAEYYNNIVSIIGDDKVNKLKEIFINEEKFLTALTSTNNNSSSNNGNITVSQ